MSTIAEEIKKLREAKSEEEGGFEYLTLHSDTLLGLSEHFEEISDVPLIDDVGASIGELMFRINNEFWYSIPVNITPVLVDDDIILVMTGGGYSDRLNQGVAIEIAIVSDDVTVGTILSISKETDEYDITDMTDVAPSLISDISLTILKKR